jgi:peptidoglycan/LPS O-acetylase OafA/YrhL
VAIAMVFLHHAGVKVPMWMEWGQMGVTLFFVISGYLVTLSLWRIEDRCSRIGIGRARELGIFQIRRLARLLPAFAAALGIGVLLGIEDVVEPFWWHVTFLSNVKMAMQGWFFGSTAHFWSLAMQEQFYIVWPFVLFAVPRRWFPVSAIVLVFGGYGYRVWCMESGVCDFWRWLMVPGSIDTFVLGGLLAWMKQFQGLPEFPSRKGGWVLLAGVTAVFWVLNRGLREGVFDPWITASVEVLEGIVALVLVWGCSKGFPGIAGAFFSWRSLRFLGRISYGIFVYHLILMWALEPVVVGFGIGPGKNVGAWILVSGAATLVVSVISWSVLESSALRYFKARMDKATSHGERAAIPSLKRRFSVGGSWWLCLRGRR